MLLALVPTFFVVLVFTSWRVAGHIFIFLSQLRKCSSCRFLLLRASFNFNFHTVSARGKRYEQRHLTPLRFPCGDVCAYSVASCNLFLLLSHISWNSIR